MARSPYRTDNIQVEVKSEVQVTRSDTASVRRAIQDINRQIDNRRSNIDAVLRDARTLDTSSVTQLITERENLNQLHERSQELQNQLISNVPSSSASLSTQEKREIAGLYQSGLYTQKQLADQYGVTQSAISQSVRNNED
ncbi:MAG: hypothetical protein L0G39_19710 [Chryseobacterium sp.]|uniref:hypothetical protein n=1 Tax=Acinetobacter TaxID=469 RepID=UPI0015B48983|nr:MULTISPECIES: hypothetical protein [Acinetobacter]MBT0888485.1 hypothetical protein [Acinetobacter towneri]MDN5479159.1 hypothetical protein [Chryseobacterium sp.]MDN5630119.1 hypothetical protein [Lactococcus sp.]NWJ93889.1 hypothetical protein [Acinetobacter sp. Swhac1]